MQDSFSSNIGKPEDWVSKLYTSVGHLSHMLTVNKRQQPCILTYILNCACNTVDLHSALCHWLTAHFTVQLLWHFSRQICFCYAWLFEVSAASWIKGVLCTSLIFRIWCSVMLSRKCCANDSFVHIPFIRLQASIKLSTILQLVLKYVLQYSKNMNSEFCRCSVLTLKYQSKLLPLHGIRSY